MENKFSERKGSKVLISIDSLSCVPFFCCFLHPKTFFFFFLLSRERKKKRKGKREKSTGEGDINWLPSIHAWTEDP